MLFGGLKVKCYHKGHINLLFMSLSCWVINSVLGPQKDQGMKIEHSVKHVFKTSRPLRPRVLLSHNSNADQKEVSGTDVQRWHKRIHIDG